MSGNHVRMMTCRFCGKETNALALSTKIVRNRNGDAELKDLPEVVLDPEPCDSCKGLFDTGWLYFMGDCGHAGFVKQDGLTPEGLAGLKGSKLFRMEKCFKCLGMTEAENRPSAG